MLEPIEVSLGGVNIATLNLHYNNNQPRPSPAKHYVNKNSPRTLQPLLSSIKFPTERNVTSLPGTDWDGWGQVTEQIGITAQTSQHNNQQWSDKLLTPNSPPSSTIRVTEETYITYNPPTYPVPTLIKSLYISHLNYYYRFAYYYSSLYNSSQRSRFARDEIPCFTSVFFVS